MLQTARMAATIGPNDVDLYESPLPDLLHGATGITPVQAGGHVLLDDLGVRSAQRLGLGDVGGNVVVALWPAELKEQAKYLYGRRLGRPMIAAARERELARPSRAPHLAFRNASPTLRRAMAPHVDAAEYARRWEEGDLERVGAHAREDVRDKLLAVAQEPRLRHRLRRQRAGGVARHAPGEPPGAPATGRSAQADVARERAGVAGRGVGARRGD